MDDMVLFLLAVWIGFCIVIVGTAFAEAWAIRAKKGDC